MALTARWSRTGTILRSPQCLRTVSRELKRRKRNRIRPWHAVTEGREAGPKCVNTESLAVVLLLDLAFALACACYLIFGNQFDAIWADVGVPRH